MSKSECKAILCRNIQQRCCDVASELTALVERASLIDDDETIGLLLNALTNVSHVAMR